VDQPEDHVSRPLFSRDQNLGCEVAVDPGEPLPLCGVFATSAIGEKLCFSRCMRVGGFGVAAGASSAQPHSFEQRGVLGRERPCVAKRVLGPLKELATLFVQQL
jgi:hypothetical protein